jgi:hypothetical protein
LRIDDVLGAAGCRTTAKSSPKELRIALPRARKIACAIVVENSRVLNVVQRDGRATGVETEKGLSKPSM